MNSNRHQSIKENCNTLVNGKTTAVPIRPFAMKELSFNNSYLVSKTVKTQSIDWTVQEVPKEQNCQEVNQYQLSIFDFLRKKDSKFSLNPLYMETQLDINPRMRSILIDWLIDVHIKFKLVPQTLFMTVDLIDRFLSKQPIARQALQLVGITALMIVAKYEEIYPPKMRNYVQVTADTYTINELKNMEGKILLALEFNLNTIISSLPE